MRDITITVASGSGVGKTTVAELINDFLIEQGFATVHVEFEELNWVSREQRKQQRIEAVKERAFITIVEKQTPLTEP